MKYWGRCWIPRLFASSLQNRVTFSLVQSCPMSNGIKVSFLSIRLESVFDERLARQKQSNGSISQSGTLVELIAGQSPTADQTITKMTDELKGLPILQLTQNKIQEVLDKFPLNKFIKKQTSEREKAPLLSSSQASITSSVIGSSHNGYRSLSLAKRAAAHDWALPRNKKGSVLIVKQDHCIHSVIMLIHATAGAIPFRCTMDQGTNFLRLQRCQPVASL